LIGNTLWLHLTTNLQIQEGFEFQKISVHILSALYTIRSNNNNNNNPSNTITIALKNMSQEIILQLLRILAHSSRYDIPLIYHLLRILTFLIQDYQLQVLNIMIAENAAECIENLQVMVFFIIIYYDYYHYYYMWYMLCVCSLVYNCC
jgi:hypothetical protein